MTTENNIKAILENCFTESKDDIHQRALKSIMKIVRKSRAADDLISRKEAIDAIVDVTTLGTEKALKAYVEENNNSVPWLGGVVTALNAVEDVPAREEATFDQVKEYCVKRRLAIVDNALLALGDWPTIKREEIYGYNVEHLAFIATALRKANLPPEKVAEAIFDIDRMVETIRKEMVDELNRAIKSSTQNVSIELDQNS